MITLSMQKLRYVQTSPSQPSLCHHLSYRPTSNLQHPLFILTLFYHHTTENKNKSKSKHKAENFNLSTCNHPISSLLFAVINQSSLSTIYLYYVHFSDRPITFFHRKNLPYETLHLAP